MSEHTTGAWEGQERPDLPRLRFLLDSMGERIAELHREIKAHAAQMATIREQLDQLRDKVGGTPPPHAK